MDSQKLKSEIVEIVRMSGIALTPDFLFLAYPEVPQVDIRIAIAELCEAGLLEPFEGGVRLAVSAFTTAAKNRAPETVVEPYAPIVSEPVPIVPGPDPMIAEPVPIVPEQAAAVPEPAPIIEGRVSVLDFTEMFERGEGSIQEQAEATDLEESTVGLRAEDDERGGYRALVGKGGAFGAGDEPPIDDPDEARADADSAVMLADELVGGPNDEDGASVEGLLYSDSVKRLDLSVRPSRVLKNAGIKRIHELVSSLEAITKQANCGEKSKEEMLDALEYSARGIHIPLTASQLQALCAISGSLKFVYSAHGMLCRAPKHDDLEPDSAVVLLGADIESVDLGDLAMHRHIADALKRRGIYTVGDVLEIGRDRLLMYRGIGIVKVEELFDAIESLQRNKGLIHTASQVRVVEDGYKNLLQMYSPEVVTIAEQASELCEAAGYPVQKESFMACYIRLAQDCLNKCGNDPVMAATSLFQEIEGSEDLRYVCVLQLKQRIWKIKDKARKGATDTSFVLESGAIWENAARELSSIDEEVSYDEEHREVSLRLPTVREWLDTLEGNRRAVMEARIAGKSLMECAGQIGVTRERVRQLQEDAMSKRPALAEDTLAGFVNTYSMNAEQFCEITGLDQSAYNYLNLAADSRKYERRALADALDDEKLPDEYKGAIRRISDVGYGYIGGNRVHLDRRSVLESLVEVYASEESISLQRLRDEYNAFLESNDVEGLEAFDFSDEHNLKALLERSDYIMFASAPQDETGEKRPLRYYDWGSYDYARLEQALVSCPLHDIECSTALLFRDEEMREVIDSLDLRNEYELHVAIRRMIPYINGLRLLKRPNMVFGNGNRRDQIIGLIKEIGPVGEHELAEEYERRYGVKEASFRGSYLKDFQAYCKNGVYAFVSEDLSEEQIAFLHEELSEDYVSLSVVRERFKTRFPDASASLISGENLSQLGYAISGNLAIRKDVNVPSLFSGLIDSHKVFSMDTPGFGADVFSNEQFISQIHIKERAFAIVESEKGTYVQTGVLSELDDPVTNSDFRSYINDALEFMVDGTPYTIQSLRLDGFEHSLDVLRKEMGFGDYFYASVLSQAFMGGRVKLTTINNVKVFCERSGSFAATDFFELILKDVESIEVDELAGLLAEKYGIDVTNSYIRSTAKRSRLYFSESVDMIFESVEAYGRKVEEWI